MGIPIDTSEPLLFNSDLARLIEAVLGADPNDEHDWIEWKRRLDLTTTGAQEHVAKHVLGMANRMVATAAGHMGGYGYILIGVEPGSITGVDTLDPTKLTDAILRYVGTDGPRWNAEYVVVGAHTVLVVVVWPPRHGDPVHTLRRRLAQHEPGRVLVRRIGQTKEASPAEHAALVERAKANQNTITVAARALRDTIDAGPQDLPAQLESALAAERELLMHPSRSARPSPPAGQAPWWMTPQSAAAFASIGRPLFGPTYEEDIRTTDEYAEEVDAYLDLLRERLSAHLTNRWWNSPGGMLRLAIDNLTPRNFAQVRTRVHVSGRVRTWPEDLLDGVGHPRQRPNRPRRMGERKRVASPYDGFMNLHPASLGAAAISAIPRSSPSPGFTACDGGSVDIEFDPVHMHPHTPTELPPVRLLVDEPPHTELTVTWTATSESADGLASGKLTLTVTEPPPLTDLLPPDERE